MAAASVLAIGLWLTQTTPAPSFGVMVAAVGMGLTVIGLGWHLWHTVSPVSLRWDGTVWHLGPLITAGDESASGQVDVTIDFAAWMLLRFTRDNAQRRQFVTWIPVQRIGLEPQWHALRCALYSPRPVPGIAPHADL